MRQSSSYYQTLIDVQKEVPSLRIHTVSDTLGTEGLIKGIAQGRFKSDLVRRAFMACHCQLLR